MENTKLTGSTEEIKAIYSKLQDKSIPDEEKQLLYKRLYEIYAGYFNN